VTRRRSPAWALVLLLLAGCRSDARRAPADAAVAAPPLEFLVAYSGGAKPTDTLPMIIAVHGLGDRPERFRGFLQRFDRPARVIVPRAPTAHGDGLSWFRVGRFPVDPAEPRLDAGVRAAAKRLVALIDYVVPRYPTRGKPVITGFSQGGILSFAVAVTAPDRIAGAVPVAGALPVDWLRGGDGPRVPIRAFHGADDRVVPLVHARRLVDALHQAGWDAQIHVYPGVGHAVARGMRGEIFQALRGMLR